MRNVTQDKVSDQRTKAESYRIRSRDCIRSRLMENVAEIKFNCINNVFEQLRKNKVLLQFSRYFLVFNLFRWNHSIPHSETVWGLKRYGI